MSDTSKSLMSRHEYLIGSARAFVPEPDFNLPYSGQLS